MLPLLKTMLLAVVLSGSPESLPTLQSVQPDQIPSLSSVATNVPPITGTTMSMTCYLGNPRDGNSLGDLTVTNAAAAGPACNSMYYVCNGRCYGCFADFDYSQDICVDNNGRKFLRD